MRYKKIIDNISKKVDQELKDLSAVYNFDLGDEFEIAICNILNKVLPDRFGVCRGFAIDEKGNLAGDDIFIFDKVNFPSLRFLDISDLSRKHELPIEAIYAYIEAKHTLVINGNSPQSLFKALTQCSDVKKLVLSRQERSHYEIIEKVNFSGLNINGPKNYPSILNPVYTMVFANNIKINQTDKSYYTDIDFPYDKVDDDIKNVPNDFMADCILLGQHNLMLPTLIKEGKEVYSSPFYLPGKSILSRLNTPNIAHAASILVLLEAIEWIRLKSINWHKIFAANVFKTIK